MLWIILKVGIKTTMGFESDHRGEIKLTSWKCFLTTTTMGPMCKCSGCREERRQQKRKQ